MLSSRMRPSLIPAIVSVSRSPLPGRGCGCYGPSGASKKWIEPANFGISVISLDDVCEFRDFDERYKTRFIRTK